jgi:hypothetical protein
MNGTLLALLFVLPGLGLPVLLTWWITMKLVPPRPRRFAKWLYPAIALIIAGWFIGGNIAAEVEEGDCVCTLCGRSTRLVSLGPIQIETALKEPRGVDSSDVYERAFSKAGSAPHRHQWLRVGCYSRGVPLPFINTTMWTCCTKIESAAWFRDLPMLRDRDLARACADRLAVASVGEQHEILHRFDFAASEQKDPEIAFGSWHEEWRAKHPDWP